MSYHVLFYVIQNCNTFIRDTDNFEPDKKLSFGGRVVKKNCEKDSRTTNVEFGTYLLVSLDSN